MINPSPNYDETLVAIDRLGANQYQVVELPRRSTETTQSPVFQTRGDAQDLVDENWAYGNYQFVDPQDIKDECNRRNDPSA